MDKSDLLTKIVNICVEQLGVTADAVKEESKFIDDLGADSLDSVELVMAIEDEFDVEITDQDAEKLVSVADVIEWLQENM